MREMRFIIFLFLILSCLSCSSFTTSKQTSEIQNQINSTDNHSSICQQVSGNWLTYRSQKGLGKKVCDGKPCGRSMGSLELKCENNLITGKKFLRINSTTSPSEIYLANVTSDWNGQNLILNYTDSCLVSYKILEIEGNKMFGEVSFENCKEPDWLPYHHGDLTVIRDFSELK